MPALPLVEFQSHFETYVPSEIVNSTSWQGCAYNSVWFKEWCNVPSFDMLQVEPFPYYLRVWVNLLKGRFSRPVCCRHNIWNGETKTFGSRGGCTSSRMSPKAAGVNTCLSMNAWIHLDIVCNDTGLWLSLHSLCTWKTTCDPSFVGYLLRTENLGGLQLRKCLTTCHLYTALFH